MGENEVNTLSPGLVRYVHDSRPHHPEISAPVLAARYYLDFPPRPSGLGSPPGYFARYPGDHGKRYGHY